MENIGQAAESPLTWTVDIDPEAEVVLQVQDSTGLSGQSQEFLIHNPTPETCQLPPSRSSDGGIPTLGGGGLNNTNTVPTGIDDPSGAGGDSGSGGVNSAPVSSTSQSGDSSQDSSSPSQESAGSSADVSNDTGSTSPPSSSLTPTQGTTQPTSSTQPKSFSQFSRSRSFHGTDLPGAATSPGASDIPGVVTGEPPPALSIVSSTGGDASSSETAGANTGSNFSSNDNVMSGSIIGGVIAAVLVALLAGFCVIRRCRRRRRNVATVVYPFDVDGIGHDTTAREREMTGRAGYPASTFSSWGNHGDLDNDERAISPAAPSTEGGPLSPWEAAESQAGNGHGQGTIANTDDMAFRARYQPQPQAAIGAEAASILAPGPAPFAPLRQHASSSSIDRLNDPSGAPRQRLRGPIPKGMLEAYRAAGPSHAHAAAFMGDPLASPIQGQSSHSQVRTRTDAHTSDTDNIYAHTPATHAHAVNEIPLQVMPSWGVQVAGRHPIVNYPPPYSRT